MLSCIDCRNLLLDDLYGLLDEPQTGELRAHLADCAACRAAQANATAQQQMLAKAAHVCVQVPLFHAPADEISGVPTAAPATLPLSPPCARAVVRPRRTLRRWLGAAAAAAVVFGVIWGWWTYDLGLRQHENELAKLRQQTQGVQDRFVRQCADYEIQQKEAPGLVEKQFLQMQVLGPGDIQPGVANAYRVLTEDLHGQRQRAQVTVRLLHPKNAKVLGSWEYQSSGEMDVLVPASALATTDEAPLLQIEARTPTAREEIRKPLPLAPAVYVSQLVLNKTAFHPGERLFFRSLTLERFSLHPPRAAAEEWEVDYRLLAADGKVMRRFGGTTKQGIAGGDFTLDGFLLPGVYTFALSAANSSGPRLFVATQRQLTILHPESPLIVFDRQQYGPNEKVNGQVFARRLAGKTKDGQKVTIEATVGGKPVSVNGSPPGRPALAQMDATGKANFHLQTPPTLPKDTKAVVKASFSGADKREEVEQTLNLVPTPVTVKLYPEGGDLVPGVVNRIYYHAQTLKGSSVPVQGKVLGLDGKELAHFGSKTGVGGGGQGSLGSFQMTPPAPMPSNEKQKDKSAKDDKKNLTENAKSMPTAGAYRVVMKSAQGNATVVERLSIQTKGVALQVTEAVGREGQPLEVQIRDPEPHRLLLVAVVCRGRLVAQQYTVAAAAGKTVRLTPAPGARGVLRLTVYDASAKDLRPLAERLLFHKPAATLQLNATCLSATPKGTLKGGDLVDLRIQAPKAKNATVLAAVYDESRTPNEASLGIGNPLPHFFLATELEHPEDLEDAELLLGEGLEAAQTLDLFLGTQGWRRFVQPASAVTLPLLIADNRARVQTASQEALNRQRQRLWEEMEQERTALKQERQQRAAAAQDAAVALAAYRELPGQYGRLAALLALVGLFGLFALGVVAVLVQTVRGLPTPRMVLGGAVLALVLCGVTFVLTNDLRLGHPTTAPEVAKALLRPEWQATPEPELAMVRQGVPGDKTVVERLALAVDQDVARPNRTLQVFNAPTAKRGQHELLRQRSALLTNNSGLGAHLKELQQAPQLSAIAPVTMLEKKMEKAAEAAMAGSEGKGALGVAPLRHYGFQGKGQAPDMLLWHPNLTLTNGSASVRFTLPLTPGSYRVLLYGNTPDGLLGFSQSRLATKE